MYSLILEYYLQIDIWSNNGYKRGRLNPTFTLVEYYYKSLSISLTYENLKYGM